MAARGPLTFWVSAILIVAGSIALVSLGPAAPRVLREPLDSLPKTLGSWQGQNWSFSDKVNTRLQADDAVLRFYSDREGNGIWVYVAYWGKQTAGRAPHSPRLCYPGAGWVPVMQDTPTIALNEGSHRSITVNRMLFQKGNVNTRELVLYWYQTGRRVVTSEYAGKILLLYDTIWNRRSDVGFVRLSTQVSDDPNEAMARLNDIVPHLAPHLDTVLPE